MIPSTVSLSARWLLLALSLTIVSCAPKPLRTPTPTPDITPMPAITPEDSLAQARLWLLEAHNSPYPENVRLILLATDTYLGTGNTALARQAFDQLPAATAPGELHYQAVLTEAELLLQEQQALAARRRLNTLEMTLPLDALIRYHRLRAISYELTGHHLEAAREGVWLHGLLTEPQDIAENQRAIWQSLSRLSSTALIQLRLQPPPDTLSGWMELLLITRSRANTPQELQLALADWKAKYPGHPADFSVLQSFFDQTLQITPHPEHIAVLLPLSGNYRAAGEAIRNGILASYYEQAKPPAELRFYDTQADPNQTWSLYQDAVLAGAQAVIGPLTKPEVNELARAGFLAVPVLALNRADDLTDLPEGLYQFALSPEDEAKQLAGEIWRRGQQRALVLTPDNAWGERLLTEFQTQWQQLGGTLLEVQRYSRDTRERSNQVKALMNIDLSEHRQNRLTRLLGKRSEYEPRRRQDADVVVLFANPEDARLTRPLIRFHLASDLPVYATSHAYQGSFSAADKDMDGLIFSDMPWLLDQDPRSQRLSDAIAAGWPNEQNSLSRLHAFGIDAFGILPYLGELSSGQRPAFAGVTGLLSSNDRRQIERELLWARFQRGKPRLMTPVIEESTPTAIQPLKEGHNVWQLPLPASQTGPAG